jgi:hypothetical protein
VRKNDRKLVRTDPRKFRYRNENREIKNKETIEIEK